MIEIKINGLDEAISRYKAMNINIDRTLQNALFKAGQQIEASAKLLCPVDTGELRNSINVVKLENGVSVGTDCEYAVYQEFGTGSKGNPAVPHTTKVRWTYYSRGRFFTTSGNYPQPFLQPAFAANSQQIRNIIIAGLGSGGAV